MVSKDPAKVRAGALGARTRWGDHEPRTVRLDELDGPTRRLVIALINAAKAETKTAPPVSETSGKADAEVQRASAERSAA